jgi:hypothetical protein
MFSDRCMAISHDPFFMKFSGFFIGQFIGDFLK